MQVVSVTTFVVANVKASRAASFYCLQFLQ